MTLLHRGELLEGERVHPAEQGQALLRLLQPLDLLRTDVRIRHGLWRVCGNLITRRDRARGHWLVGAVLGDEDGAVDAEVLEDLVLHLLDPHPLLGPGDLVAMDAVLEEIEFGAQLTDSASDHDERRIAVLRDPLDLEPGMAGVGDRSLDPGEGNLRCDEDGLRHDELASPALAPLDSRDPCLALRLRGSLELLRANADGSHPLLAGAQGEPCIDLTLTRLPCDIGQLASQVMEIARLRLDLSLVEPLLKICDGHLIGLTRRLRRRKRKPEPLRLRRGSTRNLAQLTELLGHRRHAGIGLVKSSQGVLDSLGSLPLGLLRRDQVESAPLNRMGRGVESSLGLVVGRLDLEQARSARRPAMNDAVSEDIAGLGHDDEIRTLLLRSRDIAQLADENAAGKQAVDHRTDLVIASNRLAEPAAAGDACASLERQAGGAGKARAGQISDDEGCAASVLILEQDERRDCGVDSAHDHGVGDVTERRRYGGLGAGLDMQQARERAEDTGNLLAGRDEDCGRVLARESKA